jgi:hypothetical protein
MTRNVWIPTNRKMVQQQSLISLQNRNALNRKVWIPTHRKMEGQQSLLRLPSSESAK